MDNVQKAREARGKGIVAFAKFCLDKEYHQMKLFCFFEGEDYKYYCPRIETYIGCDYTHIISYNCNGKEEVLSAYKLITKENRYGSVKKAFFIDRDYYPLEDLDKEIYQTPCYSIENLYTSIDSFRKILNREFALSPHEKDFKKCADDYIKSQQIFHNETLFLNAWLCYQRGQENKRGKQLIKLKDFKVNRLFEKIEIDNVKCKEPIDSNKLEKFFPEHYELDGKTFENMVNNFSKVNPQATYRGKFEMEFIKKIITDLRNKNTNSQYFETKRTCVTIDPNVNPLSTLNQYADTPPCLISFLSQYKISA